MVNPLIIEQLNDPKGLRVNFQKPEEKKKEWSIFKPKMRFISLSRRTVQNQDFPFFSFLFFFE